jgi:hypothetical protein
MKVAREAFLFYLPVSIRLSPHSQHKKIKALEMPAASSPMPLNNPLMP